MIKITHFRDGRALDSVTIRDPGEAAIVVSDLLNRKPAPVVAPAVELGADLVGDLA